MVLQIDRKSRNFSNKTTFPVKQPVRYIGFGYTTLKSNYESIQANYSLFPHTAKVFHLKQCAMYGIQEILRSRIVSCLQEDLTVHSITFLVTLLSYNGLGESLQCAMHMLSFKD